MEIAWLEDLIALADFGHFSRAADHRNISQPAFSRRIKMLEDWVGAALINRDTHRIALTVAGEEFLPVARDTLRILASGRERALEAAANATATLRLASTHALSVLFFPTWFQEIDEAGSADYLVNLVTENMAGCERAIIEGRVQFLLCHDHPSTSVSMTEKHFTSLDIGRDLLRPVSMPDSSGNPLHALDGPADAAIPYLAYSPVSGMGRILTASQTLNRSPGRMQITFIAHQAAVLMTMARRGRGVAWLPLSLVDNELERGRLVAAGGPEWDIPIGIKLYRPRARQSAAAEHFWERVKAHAHTSQRDVVAESKRSRPCRLNDADFASPDAPADA